MVRLLGKESLAQNEKGYTNFSDVSALNWSSGYITVATLYDFMDGYTDDRFGPDNNMTLEQAIKGFVTALGYVPTIGALGYPLDYIDKANQIGITKDITLCGKDMISRGVLAKLITNSLEIPIMIQTGYGTNIDYVVQDGVNWGTRKTILSEYRNLVKLQVIVNSYDAYTSTSNSNNVKVTILNNYKTKYSSEFCLGAYTLDAGTSNISELVGRKAIVYVAYDENSINTPVVVTAYKDTTNSDELTILGDDIEATTAIGSTVTVAYWANTTDKTTTKITLPTTAKLYYNGDIKTAAVLTAELSKGRVYGSVSFVKNNTATTQDFDTVFVANYTNFVVNTVSASTFRVTSKNAGSILFDPSDTTTKSILYDVNGKQMNWSDLKEWDVVSCKIVNGIKKVTIGQLVNNKVTGQLVEIESGSTMAKDKFTINSKVYKIDPAIAGMLVLADQGTFYLDILGKICYFAIDIPVPNYAYVIATDLSTGIDSFTEMKLFNKNGEIITLKTSSKVKLDGVSNIPTANLLSMTGGLVAGQFITYSVNSNNEVTTIIEQTQTI